MATAFRLTHLQSKGAATTCFLLNTQDVAMRSFAGRKIYTACVQLRKLGWKQQMLWWGDFKVSEEGAKITRAVEGQ